MNLNDIIQLGTLLEKSVKCPKCKSEYSHNNISVFATTKMEGMFELVCPKCQCQVVLTTSLKYEKKLKTKQAIKKDEVKSIKKFLTTFDGNFEDIFKHKK